MVEIFDSQNHFHPSSLTSLLTPARPRVDPTLTAQDVFIDPAGPYVNSISNTGFGRTGSSKGRKDGEGLSAQGIEMRDVDTRYNPDRARSRSPSPARPIGFSAAVTNLCEQAHEIADRDRLRDSYRRKKGDDNLNIPASPRLSRGRQRQRRPPLTTQRQVIGSPNPSPLPSRSGSREPLYRATSLETRSRSPSPTLSPTPTLQHDYYGTANLTDRSRSPSPARASPAIIKRPRHNVNKPSSLNLPPRLEVQPHDNMPHVAPSPTIPPQHRSPDSINFPRLNASPTHAPKLVMPPRKPSYHSFNQGPMPISPTEQNNLNMNNRRQRPRPDERRPRDERYGSGPLLNNGQRDRYREHEGGRAATSRSSSNLPGRVQNGFNREHRASYGSTSALDRRPSPHRTRHEQTDSDDEDWC